MGRDWGILFAPGVPFTNRLLDPFIVLECEQIKAAFECEFRMSHNIVLQGGAREPVYLPAGENEPNRLCFTHDYPASALHEIAHWCLAREEQLALRDWGLWYFPDGRSAAQQAAFEKAEARVQAIEWILSFAAGRRFRESCDNLGGEMTDARAFKDAIHAYVLRFCVQGLPVRAARLATAFAALRGCQFTLSENAYRRAALDEMQGAGE